MGTYIPHSAKDVKEMLAVIGVSDLDALYADIDDELKCAGPDLPQGMSESEVRRKMKELAAKNRVYTTVMRGAGAYRHYIPEIVDNVVSRPSFLTAYTPYQAEMSQGVLQAIFEYQTYMARITGMEVANASMYSGATAAAEAVMQLVRPGGRLLTSDGIRPDTMEVLKTYLSAKNIDIVVVKTENGVLEPETLQNALTSDISAVYVEQPAYFGGILDLKGIGAAVKAIGAKYIVGGNPLAYALLPSPGEAGADVAVGDAQPFGIPLSFGGAYVGYYATKKSLVRKMPGRIVGRTSDSTGRRAFALTLQPREQHIKRERALSNICSNQALQALRVAVYLAATGASGLEKVARSCYLNAHYAAERFERAGMKRAYPGEFFNEFVTYTPGKSAAIEEALGNEGILSGLRLDEDRMLWCFTELNTIDEIERAARTAEEAI